MGFFSLSDGGRMDLSAMALISVFFIGLVHIIKVFNKEDEHDVVANAAFVIWLVTTILSCILCDGLALFRAGRVLFIVWMALATYFLATTEWYAVGVAGLGIVTGIVLIQLGIYSSEEDPRRPHEPKDYVFSPQDGQARGRDHRYELAVVEDKEEEEDQDQDNDNNTVPTTGTASPVKSPAEAQPAVAPSGADVI